MICDFPTSLIFDDDVAFRPAIDSGMDFDVRNALAELFAAASSAFGCCLSAEMSNNADIHSNSKGICKS